MVARRDEPGRLLDRSAERLVAQDVVAVLEGGARLRDVELNRRDDDGKVRFVPGRVEAGHVVEDRHAERFDPRPGARLSRLRVDHARQHRAVRRHLLEQRLEVVVAVAADGGD